jgi:hypothetical protein
MYMRFEWILMAGTLFVLSNIWTDGKILKIAYSYKKYYKMGAVIFGAMTLYWMFKKNPTHMKDMVMTTSEYLKYMPLDRDTTSALSPILDFTSRYADGGEYPMLGLGGRGNGAGRHQYAEERVMTSGLPSVAESQAGVFERNNDGTLPRKATKRSVSETKKKFVAARQNWHCGDCQKQLPAWFEVDHKIRLEYGGSNHVDNLVALCRDCHGKKTAIENL